MGWTQDSKGIWTLTTTGDRYAVVSDDAMPASHALVAEIANPADTVAVIFRSSPDGGTCWEVYTTAGTGGNLAIRKRSFGTAAAAAATAAHGLTTGQVFRLEIRIESGVVNAYLDGSDTPTLTHTIGSDFDYLDRYGFAGAVHGSKVLRLQTCQIIPLLSERTDILLAGAAGEVWASTDGETLFQVASGVMRASGDISVTSFTDQKLYMVDGQHCKRFDPETETIEDVVPTAGSLPGATGGVSGSTTATLIATHAGRLVFNYGDTDPQNLLLTAVGDALDLDTGAVTFGHAYVLGGAGGSESVKVGEPITCLQPTSSHTLIVGCTGQIWKIQGDPAIGGITTPPLALDVGISGGEASFLLSEGLVIAHAPEGVLLIAPDAQEVRNISRDVLNEGIQYLRQNRADYRVTVVRDPTNHGTHIFRTPRDETVAGEHFWYDHRIADQLGPGGFFPDSFHLDAEPTAAVLWRGKPLLGCRDGYLRAFDWNETDDDLQAIDCYWPVTLLDLEDSNNDTLLNKLNLVLGESSAAVSLNCYGGASAEQAHNPSTRYQLFGPVTFGYNYPPLVRRVRAPALVLQLRNNAAGQAPSVEIVEVHLRTGAIRRRWGVRDAPTVPTACPPVVSSAAASSSIPTTFSSGPGGTSTSLTGSGSGTATPTPTPTAGTSTPTTNTLVTPTQTTGTLVLTLASTDTPPASSSGSNTIAPPSGGQTFARDTASD